MSAPKVLVTGAGGFIGSHLTEYLIKQGYAVRAFVRYSSSGQCGWLENSPLRKEIEFVKGDVRDFDSVNQSVQGVDRIFHLAALIGIPYSYESPLAYLRTNVEGTYNIVECARRRSVSRVLVTSTSEVYGTAQYVPIDEKHPLQPQSPYSASKIGADNLALSYYNSFATPVVVARPFNTYGPRQSSRAIIPTIASQLLSGSKTLKLGNLSPFRDLTFVSDTVSGLEFISRTDSLLGKSVNIGIGNGVTVGDLVQKISTLLNVTVQVEEDAARLRPDNSEVFRLLSDNQLLKSQSKWVDKVSIDEGLKQTVDWMRENLHLYRPESYHV